MTVIDLHSLNATSPDWITVIAVTVSSELYWLWQNDIRKQNNLTYQLWHVSR